MIQHWSATQMNQLKRRALTLVQQLARMTRDGDEVDGKPFEMDPEDAREALNSMIDEARAVIEDRHQHPLALIIIGNPVDGLRFYGPFTSAEEANLAADSIRCEEEWWVT